MGTVRFTSSTGAETRRRTTRATKRLRIIHEDVVQLDLGGLADAKTLTELTVYGAELPKVDLSPLEGHASIDSITLERVGELDLGPLRSCPALEGLTLSFRGKAAVDLAPLAGHPGLTRLSITCEDQEALDLSVLRKLPGLRELSIKGGEWRELDLSPARGLPLSQLTLSQQYIDALDLTGLVGEATEQLFLENLEVRTLDLAPLASSPRLAHLSLQHLRLEQPDGPALNLEPIRHAEALSWFSLAHTELAYLDVSPLAKMERLAYVELGNVKDVVIDAGEPLAGKGLRQWKDQLAVL